MAKLNWFPFKHVFPEIWKIGQQPIPPLQYRHATSCTSSGISLRRRTSYQPKSSIWAFIVNKWFLRLKLFKWYCNSIEYLTYRDEEISKGSTHKSAVQIKPQHVSIRMRVGQPFDMNMQYSQAEDYPVDLYYLMDLSKSMEDDKVHNALLW